MPNLVDTQNRLKPFTITLGGKQYVTVAGRVFAAHDARQLIGVDTTLEETDKHYRMVATAYVLNTHLVADFEQFLQLPTIAQVGTFQGSAQSPKTGGKSAEGSSPLEVAETSAVGRALGFAGFGVLESIATHEEVQAALDRQGNTPTAAQKKQVFDLAKKTLDIKDKDAFDTASLAKYGVPAADLTATQITDWIKELATQAGAVKADF